jgi:hypothetical protein
MCIGPGSGKNAGSNKKALIEEASEERQNPGADAANRASE